jgi:hypothetical protein
VHRGGNLTVFFDKLFLPSLCEQSRQLGLAILARLPVYIELTPICLADCQSHSYAVVYYCSDSRSYVSQQVFAGTLVVGFLDVVNYWHGVWWCNDGMLSCGFVKNLEAYGRSHCLPFL